MAEELTIQQPGDRCHILSLDGGGAKGFYSR